MDIVDAYRNYYSSPNIETVRNLKNHIDTFDMASYKEVSKEIASLWKVAKSCYRLPGYFQTNGTTQLDLKPNQYLFGPYRDEWHKAFTDSTATLHVYTLINQPIIGSQWYFKKDPYWQDHFLLSIDLWNPSSPKIVLNVLEFMKENVGKFQIKGYPYTLRYFVDNQSISSWIRQNYQHVISLTNTDFDMFVNTQRIAPIPIKDQMIDWQSGIMFYTCKSNQKHFLPTFAQEGNKHINLLNTTSKNNCDIQDLVEFEDPVRCTCGKNRLKCRFIPHIKFAIQNENRDIVYDLDFFQHLEGKYINLQFIQDPDTLTVQIPYIKSDGSQMCSEDEDRIINFLSMNKVRILNFQRNCFFLAGRKTIGFFQNRTKKQIEGFDFQCHCTEFKTLETKEPQFDESGKFFLVKTTNEHDHLF